MTLDRTETPEISALESVAALTQEIERLEDSYSPLELARIRLYRAIRAARAEGHTLQQIADAAGVTRQRVHQVLEGRNEQ